MLVAGTDETGVGCLAGPMVAVTVVLDTRNDLYLDELDLWWPLEGVDDSKKLSPKRREEMRTVLTDFINEHGEAGVGKAPIYMINQMGHADALRHALSESIMAATVDAGLRPDILIIDGTYKGFERYPWKQMSVPKADATYFAVAAASILAKIIRDDIMESLDREFPDYGWAQNKGYPSAQHRDALVTKGMTKYHRDKACQTVLKKNPPPRRVPKGW